MRYTPAVTIVAAWISAETGDGPSIASGSQTCNGSCASCVAEVTIVRAESDVGLPNGPSSSATVSRPATWTTSLRMPAYSSPSRPIRRVTGPRICARSYRPYGSWNSTEHQLATSTIALMRGIVPPLRMRRSSASFDGRVFVGSSPSRLYMPANGGRLVRRKRADFLLGVGQQGVQRRRPLDDGGFAPPQHAGADDRRQLGREGEAVVGGHGGILLRALDLSWND